MTDRKLQQVIEQIEQAANNKTETLDLGFKQLTSLPPEIGQLNHLKFLDLRNNKLTQLPPEIGRLTSLTSLNIVDNQLEILPPEMGRLSKLQRLSLSYNRLENLPSEIGQLIQLSEFYLSHNCLENLPPAIKKLSKLQRFSLSNNCLVSLPSEIGCLSNLIWFDLNSNKLNDLPPEIGQLTQLVELDLRYNELPILPREIGYLINLTQLKLNNNRLITLPAEIGELINLESLQISNNQLNYLPTDIGKLNNLIELDLIYNQLTLLPREIGYLTKITDLKLNKNKIKILPPEISHLTKLKTLTLKSNQLTALPTEIIQLVRFSKLKYLDLSDNFLPIPPEFIWKKDEPTVIINIYEQYLNSPTKPLNEAKVLLVGQGTVGKTSLLRRLLYKTFNPEQDKTEGIEIHPWRIEVKNQQIQLNVWDFGGQEIYHATHQFFLTHRSLYLLVLDSRQDEKDNQLEYWLQMIKSYGNNSPIIIVSNKIDQHSLDLDRRGLKKKHDNIKAFIETSCRTGKQIEELATTIAEEISKLEHIHNELPQTWLTVKTQLESMKNRQMDYISYADYQEMCRKEGIMEDEQQRTLISFLHDLGVVLNFQDDLRLKDTNILNPVWVTHGVYKILNDEALEKRYKGILSLGMLERILDDRRYPTNKHLFIIDMMRKFELCFELNSGDEKEFLIPDLLPKEEPETGDWHQALAFEYHYNVLPSSIISRFIVRMNHLIDQNTYWRNGVMLTYEGNTALIKADRYSNKIFIWVRGFKDTQRDFLKSIRVQFKQIHDTIPNLEVREKVVLPHHPQVFVDYEHLLNLEQMGRETFVPERLKEEVNVKELLEGFIAENERIEQQDITLANLLTNLPIRQPREIKVSLEESPIQSKFTHQSHRKFWLNRFSVFTILFVATVVIVLISQSIFLNSGILALFLGLLVSIIAIIIIEFWTKK